MANEERITIIDRDTLEKADMESMVEFIKTKADITDLQKAEFALALVESTTKARAYIKKHFFKAKSRAEKVDDLLTELGITKADAEKTVAAAKKPEAKQEKTKK